MSNWQGPWNIGPDTDEVSIAVWARSDKGKVTILSSYYERDTGVYFELRGEHNWQSPDWVDFSDYDDDRYDALDMCCNAMVEAAPDPGAMLAAHERLAERDWSDPNGWDEEEEA